MKRILFLTMLLINTSYIQAALYGDTSGTKDKIKAAKLQRFQAKDSHEVYDPFINIYIGAFHAFTKSSITFNSDALGRGTTIDPETVFGHKDRRILPRAEVIINPGKRHAINLTYWTVQRNRTRVLQENVNFGDTTFYINSSVTSKLKLTNYSGSYRFSIFAKPHWEAGLSLGGKFIDSYNSVRANLNGHTYSVTKQFYAPIPLGGIHATVNSGKHFLFRGTAEYFKLEIDDWDFHTLDLRGGIEYYPFKHIGIGLDYHYFDTLIRKVPSGKLNGEIELNFHAVSLYLGIRI